MTALWGIAVGILGGAVALIVVCSLLACVVETIRACWRAGWPGLLAVILPSAWMVVALILVLAFPVALVAWLVGADSIASVARQFVGWTFWPTVIGFPLIIWVSKFGPEDIDAGQQVAAPDGASRRR